MQEFYAETTASVLSNEIAGTALAPWIDSEMIELIKYSLVIQPL